MLWTRDFKTHLKPAIKRLQPLQKRDRDNSRFTIFGMVHRMMVATPQPETYQTLQFPSETPDATGDIQMTSAIATLGSLKVGQSGRIIGYESGSRAYRGQLLSMGLTPGTEFTVSRQAPLGDPVEIEVRGFKLSLRKGEAEALQVETVGGD